MATTDQIVLGIDLGTTFSVVAYVDESGKPQVIKNRDGDSTTPSVVLFEDGGAVVGSSAKDQSIVHAEAVVQFVKRHMGDPSFTFRSPDGKRYRAEEISALILKNLKEDAEAALGRVCRYAVVTVPAYFDDSQRKATQDAARIAGLDALRIINEPTAAALAYGIDGVSRPEHVLVYDLGGGTFDVTILRVANGELDAITTDGDRELGGKDWDDALIGRVRKDLVAKGATGIDSDPNLVQELREKCEKAKIQLSSREKTSVPIAVGSKRFNIEVLRRDFEQDTEMLLQRTIALVEGCLDTANLTWGNIDKVLLVGGSSRLPRVAEELERVSGKRPSRELDPDLVVACGAAVLGAKTPVPVTGGTMLPVAAAAMPDMEVRDICSHSLGTIANNEEGVERNSIIIPKDTKLPCVVSEDFSTASEGQTAVNIRVTQGEDDDLEYVKIVGETELTIPPYPRGAPIRIQLSYDVDAIIRVRVIDLTPQPPRDLGEFSISRNANLADDELEALRRRIASLATT